MDNHQIQEWTDSLCYRRSEFLDLGYCPMESREDPIAKMDCIRAYLTSMESSGVARIYAKAGMDYKYGLMLTGPKGSGKHTAATSIVASVLGRSNHASVYWVSGRDFEEDEQIAAMQMTELFARYTVHPMERDEQLIAESDVVLLEYLEDAICGKTLLKHLENILEICQSGNYVLPLVILVTRQELTEYPGLRGNLLLCRYQIPTSRERAVYLERRYVCVPAGGTIDPEKSDRIRINDMTQATLVSKTAGMNFHQLEEVLRFAKLRVIDKATRSGIRDAAQFHMCDFPLTVIELAELLSTVQPIEQDSHQVQTAAADQLLAPILEQLTSAIAAIPAGTAAQPAQPAAPNTQKQGYVNRYAGLDSENTYDPRKNQLLKTVLD